MKKINCVLLLFFCLMLFRDATGQNIKPINPDTDKYGYPLIYDSIFAGKLNADSLFKVRLLWQISRFDES